MIEWLPWLPSKSCYTNLKFFETLKDTPNPSKGFRFVAFLILQILGGGSFLTPPPLVLGVGTKTLGARRVKQEIKDKFDSNHLLNVGNHFPGKGVGTDHTFVVCREKRKPWIKAYTGRDMRECLSIQGIQINIHVLNLFVHKT